MIVYYITAHGFGHAVRACEVIRNLPPGLPLTLRSDVPAWFLRHELGGRRFEHAPDRFDVGVLGPDSTSVDLAATLEAAEAMQRDNDARLERETAWLREVGARVVVSDVPPFALRAARTAGIPSVLIANFTWPIIYLHLLQRAAPGPTLADRARHVIATLQAECDMGDLMLATDMAIPMQGCRARIDVPLVARRGVDRRDALIHALGLDPGRPIALLYLGRDGQQGMHWDRLDRLDPWQWVGFDPPADAAGRVHALPEDLLRHVDAAASVDVVLGKAGYGLCGECIANGTPLVYPPRPDFAEIHAVDELMARWGGGVSIAAEDFRALNWGPALERACHLHPPDGRIDVGGGAACADWIERAWRTGSADPDVLESF